MEPDRFDNVDELIDAGLAAYAPEPLAGLEDRVLTRARLETRRRRIAWWWVLGVPAIAAVIVLSVLSTRGSAPRPTPTPIARMEQPTAPAPPPVVRPVVRRRAVKHSNESPK